MTPPVQTGKQACFSRCQVPVGLLVGWSCYSCLAIELCLRDLVLPLGHPEHTCAHGDHTGVDHELRSERHRGGLAGQAVQGIGDRTGGCAGDGRAGVCSIGGWELGDGGCPLGRSMDEIPPRATLCISLSSCCSQSSTGYVECTANFGSDFGLRTSDFRRLVDSSPTDLHKVNLFLDLRVAFLFASPHNHKAPYLYNVAGAGSGGDGRRRSSIAWWW